jgi:hypothetical protein
MSTEITPRLRGQRLSVGKCPEHGLTLVGIGPMLENEKPVGTTYGCPEKGCAFDIVARTGSRLQKLLR